MKKIFIFVLLIAMGLTSYASNRDYYIIQIYHCSNEKQIANIDDYLKNIYLPYLHNHGIKKVGVFAPIANDTAIDKKIYVWIPVKNIAQIDKLDNNIEQLDPMGNDPLIHLELADGSLPYNRIEKIICKAGNKSI